MVHRVICLVFVLLSIRVLAAPGWFESPPLNNRFKPMLAKSGFRMEGYWVWCGSPIKVGDEYHLFASRWPKTGEFPDGYREHSEIVRAVSKDPLGPYVFQEVVIHERSPGYWDSNMAHNPAIYRIGGTYVLFYIGSDFATLRPGTRSLIRRIGYATAPEIRGPWTRSDHPVIQEESNNPAVFTEPDGAVKLMYRDANLRVILAAAKSYQSAYQTMNADVWPRHKLEDFFLFKHEGRYFSLCEDNTGGLTGHERWGGLLVSPDGINGWQAHKPVVFYDHEIALEAGGRLHCTRRERPQLLIQNGRATHLFTAVYDGKDSWNQAVELLHPLPVD